VGGNGGDFKEGQAARKRAILSLDRFGTDAPLKET